MPNIFNKNKLVYAGSDFTIHSIEKDYKNSLKDKCLIINDLSLLISSKALRTRQRLINVLAELWSEGIYTYSDFQKSFTIKGKFSMVANITPSMFTQNRKTLLELFADRCLVIHYRLTNSEMSEGNLQRQQRNKLKIGRFKQKLREGDVSIRKDDLVRFDEYAKRWRVYGGYSTTSRLFDMIKSMVVAYAILSEHKNVGEEEYQFLNILEQYIRNPSEPLKTQIVELASQGRTVKDICLILNKEYENFRSYVSRVLREARVKGVVNYD